MFREQAHAIRTVADTIYDDGYTEEAEVLAAAAAIVERTPEAWREPEKWQRLIHESGERFGWAWIDYQSTVLGVFDQMEIERADVRLLAVKLAIAVGEAVVKDRERRAQEAGQREVRPGAPHTPCGPFFPSGKCAVCGSMPAAEPGPAA